ncbi:peptidase U32 family protein [Pontiella sulfatireligans]|uniref:peptidase U32 family protein n=1 Tax=Pontiella sulfatireligans TaxID=2750658 RepID=UPI001443B235|nr:U32 family peptidase [Pontiella sulfatireligans]
MNKPLPELLAPAGTPEAAWAALAYGADAVYAGLTQFSARAGAGNFTSEALDELIGYAHSLSRHVYVTFNTLVQQRELNAALETFALIRDLNAGGVIVQDMGMARLIRNNFPQLRLHASTQLAVHNLAGAKQLKASGFSRVVLARELRLAEIREISRNCGLETEVFIHGALCFSYSGLCLFSSHMLGRSGNRGRCAYCCRQPFKAKDENESLPFSMKDFSAASHLPALLDAGVASLKIEGRMKSPLYVAAVTEFYRKALEGDSADEEQRLSDIQTIFGRPSTGLYLDDSADNPVDPVNDGHRGALIGTVKSVVGPWLVLHSSRALQKHDGLKIESDGTHPFGFAADEMRLASDPEKKRRFELPAAAEIALKLPADSPRIEIGVPVYCSFSQAVRQRYEFSTPRPGVFRQRRPVDIHVLQSAESVALTASADCDGTQVQVENTLPGPFEPARQPEKSVEAIRRCFEKLGETDWMLGKLTFGEGSDPVFVPASMLNNARRKLIDDFSEVWNQSRKSFFIEEVIPTEPAAQLISWSVKTRCFKLLENLEGIDELVLEVDLSNLASINTAIVALPPEKLRLALPVIIREEDTVAFREFIDSLPNQQKWEAANVGGLHLLKGKADITADWPLYTLNTQAALQWCDQGIRQFVFSPEDDSQNWSALIPQLGDAAIVPVYQHTPLMISATPPAGHEEKLTDRSRRSFRIEKNGRQFVVVGKTPFSLVEHFDELKELGARRFRIDLCYGIDTSEQAGDIVHKIIHAQPINGHSGNFNRELQ